MVLRRVNTDTVLAVLKAVLRVVVFSQVARGRPGAEVCLPGSGPPQGTGLNGSHEHWHFSNVKAPKRNIERELVVLVGDRMSIEGKCWIGSRTAIPNGGGYQRHS